MTLHVYRHFDADGRLLYVGCTASVKRRMWEHSSRAPWFKSIARITTETFSTRAEARSAEALAIQREMPLHNVICGSGASGWPLRFRLRREGAIDALRRVAAERRRSINSLVNGALEEWLEDRGYLKRSSK